MAREPKWVSRWSITAPYSRLFLKKRILLHIGQLLIQELHLFSIATMLTPRMITITFMLNQFNNNKAINHNWRFYPQNS